MPCLMGYTCFTICVVCQLLSNSVHFMAQVSVCLRIDDIYVRITAGLCDDITL